MATQQSPSGTVTAGAAVATVSVADALGNAASIVLPPTNDGSVGTLAIAVTRTLPAGVVAPASLRRLAQDIGPSVTPLLYVTVQASASLTFGSTPSFSFTLPPGTSIGPGAAYLALYDPNLGSGTSAWYTFDGPGTVGGQTVTFPASAGPLSLTAGSAYIVSLFTSTQPIALDATGSKTFALRPATVTIGGLNSPVNFQAAETSGSLAPVFPGPLPGPNESFSPSSCNAGFNVNPVRSVGRANFLNVNQFKYVGPVPNPAKTAAPFVCALKLTDIVSNTSQVLTVNALPYPLVSASPNAVILAGVGQTFAKNVTISESDGSAPVLGAATFSGSTGCTTANFVAVPAGATLTIFQASPVSPPPTCTLTVPDSTSGATVQVTITTAGPPTLSLNPSAVFLSGVGAGYQVTVTAAESNGSAPILTIPASPWSVATPAPGATPNPAATCGAFSFSTLSASSIAVFETQPQVGTCNLRVNDQFNNSIQLPVTLQSGAPISIGGQ